jgi:transposase-like protein
MKKTYDSLIKLIYNLGMEKTLLNNEVRNSIPRSTASTWRNMDINEIMNVKYSEDVRKNIVNFVNQENNIASRERQYLLLLVRLREMFIDTIGNHQYKQLLKENKSRLIRIISNCSSEINRSILLKFLGLKDNTFYQWKYEVKYFCMSSATHLCVRTFPFQASSGEVNKFWKLLTNIKTIHWSISSIYGDAFKKRIIGISKATFYRYNKILGIRKKKKKTKKPLGEPLRASRPNEIWHADISEFRTEDGRKNYIYAVIDNFSRKILAWDVAHRVSGHISKRLLRQALKKNNISDLQYVTDGGPENTSKTVYEFIRSIHLPIVHKIALRDIVQSNNMIESVFRTMKSTCLRLQNIRNRRHLIKTMRWFVYEYNELKPHHSQIYYTPSEIYAGKTDTVDVENIYKKAYRNRLDQNRNCACKVCRDDKELSIKIIDKPKDNT